MAGRAARAAAGGGGGWLSLRVRGGWALWEQLWPRWASWGWQRCIAAKAAPTKTGRHAYSLINTPPAPVQKALQADTPLFTLPHWGRAEVGAGVGAAPHAPRQGVAPIPAFPQRGKESQRDGNARSAEATYPPYIQAASACPTSSAGRYPPIHPPPLGEGWGEGRAACATAGAAPIPAFPQRAKASQRRGGAHSTRILLSLMTLPHLSNSAVT